MHLKLANLRSIRVQLLCVADWENISKKQLILKVEVKEKWKNKGWQAKYSIVKPSKHIRTPA